MKNKILASVLAVLTAGALLTACGSKTETQDAVSTENVQEEAPAAEEAVEARETEEAVDTASSDGEEMVSDEIFEILQNSYSLLVEYHDAVAELYNSDEVAANPEIEELMSQAYDIIEEMGNITQEEVSPEDAETLIDAMDQIVDGLSVIVDGMEVAGDSDAADGEVVSDETFAAVQQNYEDLTTVYNIVAEAYNNGDVADQDIEDTMNQARELIEKMGTISQDNLTEADAEELVDLMVSIVEVLGVVADSIG